MMTIFLPSYQLFYGADTCTSTSVPIRTKVE